MTAEKVIELLYLEPWLSQSAIESEPVQRPFFWEVLDGQVIAVEREMEAEGRDADESSPESSLALGFVSPHEVKFQEGFEVKLVDEERQYVAKQAGVLVVEAQVHRIKPILKIHGDCSAHMSPIVSSHPIHIEGDVGALVSIKTASDLFVAGQVSNKACLDVGGDLLVEQGVVGEHTSIHVRGNADLNYVQEASIIAKGHIRVKGYVFNAHLHSEKNIEVEGLHVKVGERGAVVGGVINSMGDMLIHSAGSDLNRTQLVCGTNLLILQKMDQLRQQRSVLQKSILKEQEGLGLKVKDPFEGLKAYLLKEGAEKAKDKLGKMKGELEKLGIIKKALDQLKQKMQRDRVKLSRFMCRKFMSPDVILRVGAEQFQLYKYTLGPVESHVAEGQLELRKAFNLPLQLIS